MSWDFLLSVGDARACALASERAEGRNAFDGDAEIEDPRSSEIAEGKKANGPRADGIAVCRAARTAAVVLAGAVSRFQCVQRKKEVGKAEVYAQESSKTGTGEASERLAVEQLGVLFSRGTGTSAD